MLFLPPLAEIPNAAVVQNHPNGITLKRLQNNRLCPNRKDSHIIYGLAPFLTSIWSRLHANDSDNVVRQCQAGEHCFHAPCPTNGQSIQTSNLEPHHRPDPLGLPQFDVSHLSIRRILFTRGFSRPLTPSHSGNAIHIIQTVYKAIPHSYITFKQDAPARQLYSHEPQLSSPPRQTSRHLISRLSGRHSISQALQQQTANPRHMALLRPPTIRSGSPSQSALPIPMRRREQPSTTALGPKPVRGGDWPDKDIRTPNKERILGLSRSTPSQSIEAANPEPSHHGDLSFTLWDASSASDPFAAHPNREFVDLPFLAPIQVAVITPSTDDRRTTVRRNDVTTSKALTRTTHIYCINEH